MHYNYRKEICWDLRYCPLLQRGMCNITLCPYLEGSTIGGSTGHWKTTIPSGEVK